MNVEGVLYEFYVTKQLVIRLTALSSIDYF